MMTKDKTREAISYILGFKPVKTARHRAMVMVSHALLWGLFLAMPMLIYRIRILDGTFFYRELITKSFLVVLFYVNYYYLLPQLFQRGRIAHYFLSVTGALVVLFSFNAITEYFFREHLRLHPRRFLLTSRMVNGTTVRDSFPEAGMLPGGGFGGPAQPAMASFRFAGGGQRVEGAVIVDHQVMEDTAYLHGRPWQRAAFLAPPPGDSLSIQPAMPGGPFFRTGPLNERGIFWMGFPMVLMNTLSSGVLILLFGGFIKLANSLIVSEKQKKALENERLNAELNFLKLQINPHFLFNTLNSIYSQAHLKSEQTEYSILKFSQIMRYVLYDSTTEKIPLTRDLEYIRNYIDLQKLRISRNITIQYDVSGVTDDLLIAPLLLITFIENAFKHGISYSSPSAIDIRISVTGKDLTLTVGNTIIKKMAAATEPSGGVGLVNARRRLDVLYPNRYLLDISDNSSIYVVNLKITLDPESGHEPLAHA